MIKIFNQYYPIRNVLFVVGEGGLIFLSVILAAMVRLGGLDGGWLGDNLIWSKIFLITLVCQVSLYYFDLYDLKVTDTFL
ncbi:MAG: capsular biosynthesis protein CpsE, partial [Deltaproteobacteria bacterium]|nr:capsular biosynthesis protein CpsE [Deltaproteobacteria bacterium]